MVRGLLIGIAALAILAACGKDDSLPQASRAGKQAGVPTVLAVTILAQADDTRVATVREALNHWNAVAASLDLRVRLDSGTLVIRPLPDAALRATGRPMPGRALGVLQLRSALRDVRGDVVIALSHAEFISFGVTTGTGRVGVVGLRNPDRWPLTLPNVTRNVIAHEVGHVLGLEHNADSTTLMCGRPALCGPSAFALDSAHFFPLTAADEQKLRKRWR